MSQVDETWVGVKSKKNGVEGSADRDHRAIALAGLDVSFVAAQGDYVYWRDPLGDRRRAVDLAGAAGALLLGHNHPEVVGVALRHFHERRPLVIRGIDGASGGPTQALKSRLAERVGQETHGEYEVLLFSTGPEAVDAAVAHARLELFERQRSAEAGILSRLQSWKRRIERAEWAPDSRFFLESERTLGVERIDDFGALCQAVLAKNAAALEHPGHVLAPEGSFPGKPIDSLAGTFGADARLPFARSASNVRFLRPGDALEAIARETNETLYLPELDPPCLRCTPFSTIVSIVVEPVRADAGALEIEEQLARDVRAFRSNHPEIPVIVNETLSGLGRTGRFLEGAARGLPCDYVVLGRALGGDAAKLAAVAIDRQRYRRDFLLARTSSLVEDEYSVVVGHACLDTIDRDRIWERCARTGAVLRDELLGLAGRWPGQIADVRGRGLMLALEFREQSSNRSALLGALDEERLLTSIIAGFLLHRHDIWVLPAAVGARVLRFEPSAYFEGSEIRRVADALDEVCAILEAGDAFSLLAHIVRKEAALQRVDIVAQSPPQATTGLHRRSGVGFTSSFPASRYWADDPTLRRFRADELAKLVDVLSAFLPAREIAARSSESS